MNDLEPVEIDGITGAVHAIPYQKRYRAKLDTLGDIKREMARVYRDSRTGSIEPSDGSKYVWMLEKLGKVIETSDLESRVEKLEEKQQ